MAVGVQRPLLRLTPPEITGCPLYMRLDGPQGWSGQVQKISPPPRFYPRSVHPTCTAVALVNSVLERKARNYNASYIQTCSISHGCDTQSNDACRAFCSSGSHVPRQREGKYHEWDISGSICACRGYVWVQMDMFTSGLSPLSVFCHKLPLNISNHLWGCIVWT
jgi:hypothetical protein